MHSSFPRQRRPRTVGEILGALCAAALLSSSPMMAAAAEAHVKGRVIVTTRAGLSDADLAKVLSAHGGKATRIGKTNMHIVQLPAAASEAAVRNILGQHRHFKSVELDPIFKPSATTNDPYLGSEWHLSKIGVTTAWDSTTGAAVTIAILDSGIDASHPDLAPQLVAGWNFYANNSDTSDLNGHGTAVAGAAAAAMNNALGVASVAGGAKIMPLRVVDANGGATGSMVAQALTWAADRGVRIANISYEGVPGNSTVQQAAQYMKSKGGLVIVSAGNAGTNLNLPAETTMIPVSATDANDAVTSWSSYGNYVALAAPGLNIWTTTKGGGYAAWWGTSFSSPITAGTAALMMSLRPDLSNAQIESLLYSTATDLGTAGRDVYYGHGRVNASAAVTAAKNAAAADTTAPSTVVTGPAASSTVSGLVAVDVGATDNVGVARVELRVNGSLLATDLSAPYQFSWDSTKVANGSYTLSARAFDAAGNAGTSANVTVNVANAVAADTTPPVVAITSPTSGSKLTGTSVTVRVSASDNRGTTGLSNALYINGAKVATSTGGSLSYKWSLRKLAAGSHTVQAVSKDASGNQTSTSIQVSY